MEWYELDGGEKIKQVYSKYKIKDFFEWWSGGNPQFMEIRIKNITLIKELAAKYGFPYSNSGLYITDAQQLKTVIAAVRDKATCWFGTNPRKKNWGSGGKYKTWGAGARKGSSDDNIEAISYIFIDIDRKTKIKPANNKELKNCNIMADKILERMAINKWSESYIKICSGNGVQLLFQLDIPIKIPTRGYNKEKLYFEHSEEFEQLKRLLKDGFGANLRRFCKRFEDELMTEVDSSGFNLNRVAALPTTKNFKFDSFQWRGIVELKTGENKGLSDYIMSKMTDLKTFKSQNVFAKTKRTPGNKMLIRPGKLRENDIVKLFMDNDLPYGELNNKLWFQLKALLRDSKFDINSEEFRTFHKELEVKYNGRFTTNLPTKNFEFSVNTVNSFCINAGVEPIYKDIWKEEYKSKKLPWKLEEMEWGIQALIPEVIKLESTTTIQEDLAFVKNKLIEYDYNNINIIAAFINGCIKKYGEKKTKYFVENIFDHYLNYS